MNYENIFERCKIIAKVSHQNQFRKNGESYILHPERVASCFFNTIYKCVAILHDVLEDTKTTKKDLYDVHIPSEIIECVDILSRKSSESYFDFIMRIIDSDNNMAMAVKLSDLEDNMSDLEEGSLKDKYRFAEFLISKELESKKELYHDFKRS